MKVNEINVNGRNMVELESDRGEKMTLPWSEFWELSRTADVIDTKREVVEYLSDFGDSDIRSYEIDDIMHNDSLLTEIANRLIYNRIDNENGDQVYDAVVEVMGRLVSDKGA